MAPTRFVIPSALALALTLSFSGLATAQTAAKPAHKAAKKPAVKAAVAAYLPPAAGPEQIDAAERVYYGAYECEFNQSIHIAADPKYPAYVDVKHLKAQYLMKPVLSSTGAVRLEDTRGETLMVQIANKSMLLNVKTGQRVVDDCVSPSQRELIAAAKAAKAVQGGHDPVAASSMFSTAAPAAASAPASAAPSEPAPAAPSEPASAPASEPASAPTN